MPKKKLSLINLIFAIIIFFSLNTTLGMTVYLMQGKPKVIPPISSPTYTIEKLKDDPICSQKAKGVGYCRGFWEGYEFDAKIRKCIKTGVSGCDVEVMPFNSLSECQSVCEKSAVSGRELGFETVVKGSYGEISERKNYVITSQTEWAQLLQKTGAELPPPIDFTNNMIIAVSQGEHSTGGYSIEITKIIEKENNIEIFVKEIEPGQMCDVTQAFTYPYHVVKLQRSDKEVVFNVEKVAQCK